MEMFSEQLPIHNIDSVEQYICICNERIVRISEVCIVAKKWNYMGDNVNQETWNGDSSVHCNQLSLYLDLKKKG
jgi:hypothetical protein